MLGTCPKLGISKINKLLSNLIGLVELLAEAGERHG